MHVKQAANVLELLEFFARERRPATLAEISDALGWPRSSTFNLVTTLADQGFVYEPYQRRGYYPSPRWLALAQTIAAAEPLPEAVHLMAAEVARASGETTLVGAPAGTAVSFVHVIESAQPVRYFAQVGDRVPLQASSVGRALLAQYPQDERKAIYRKLSFEAFSPTTPLSVAAIEAELADAAARGYHQSNAEYLPDLAGVACPLPSAQRRLALVVAGPVSRCLPRRAEIAAIIQAAIARQGGADATAVDTNAD